MPVLDDMPMTCFMFLTAGAWLSTVLWNGLQSTASLTDLTSPSSNATINDMGLMTEPGSNLSPARFLASP